MVFPRSVGQILEKSMKFIVDEFWILVLIFVPSKLAVPRRSAPKPRLAGPSRRPQVISRSDPLSAPVKNRPAAVGVRASHPPAPTCARPTRGDIGSRARAHGPDTRHSDDSAPTSDLREGRAPRDKRGDERCPREGRRTLAFFPGPVGGPRGESSTLIMGAGDLANVGDCRDLGMWLGYRWAGEELGCIGDLNERVFEQLGEYRGSWGSSLYFV